MKLDNRYKMEIVVIEDLGNTTGDCSDDFEQFKKEHPHSSYKYGYIIIDTTTGLIPDECNDWNDSPKEALMDYYDNCKINCKECKNFHTCDNMGTNNTCLPGKSLFKPNLTLLSDLDYVCKAAESVDLSEEDKDALLKREDADTNYYDIYFHPMCPYSTIREAIAYREQEKLEDMKDFVYKIFRCEVQEKLDNCVRYKIIRISTGEVEEMNVSVKSETQLMKYIDKSYFGIERM